MFPAVAGYESGSLVACYPGERQASCCFWMLPHHPPKSPLTHRFWAPNIDAAQSLAWLLAENFPWLLGSHLAFHQIRASGRWWGDWKLCWLAAEFHLGGLVAVKKTPQKIVLTCSPQPPGSPTRKNNTSKQYDILITRGSMKTLAIRSDFDFKFSWFRVLI